MKPSQLSRLIDGDLDSGLLDAALRALRDDAGARETVTIHQLVGDALRGRIVEDDGYSRRILAALDAKPIDLTQSASPGA